MRTVITKNFSLKRIMVKLRALKAYAVYILLDPRDSGSLPPHRKHPGGQCSAALVHDAGPGRGLEASPADLLVCPRLRAPRRAAKPRAPRRLIHTN